MPRSREPFPSCWDMLAEGSVSQHLELGATVMTSAGPQYTKSYCIDDDLKFNPMMMMISYVIQMTSDGATLTRIIVRG